MTPVEKARIVPQCERRVFFPPLSFFSEFLLFSIRGEQKERGECESVNVFHSPDLIHRFNKAGICSMS